MLNCTIKITWSNRLEYKDKHIDDIPAKAGVYEIQGRKATDGGYTRRYLGVTDDLKKIYSEHLSDIEQNEKLKKFLKEKRAFFRYVPVDAEQTRKDVEKGLYYQYKHSFNDSSAPPIGSGRYVKIKIEEANT